MGDYELFKKKVFQLTKIDLDCYKERQMKRRIDALITRSTASDYEGYLNLLKTDQNELEGFIAYLTINVSEFYRNPEQWNLMEKEMLPYLFERFGQNIKIWSAACSTGDEPYTLVMLLSKFIPMNQIQVIATDIDKQVLSKAQMGLYDEKSLRGLPKEYVTKYFTQVGARSYQISDEVKRRVTFRQHNLLKDPYIKDCHLIVCRNVMIYFTEEAKAEINRRFCASLKKDGLLFVGSTEQIIAPNKLGFATFKSFFYKKL